MFLLRGALKRRLAREVLSEAQLIAQTAVYARLGQLLRNQALRDCINLLYWLNQMQLVFAMPE
jgi:hypothetical protein